MGSANLPNNSKLLADDSKVTIKDLVLRWLSPHHGTGRVRIAGEIRHI